MDEKILITNIQRFSLHDGPGIRTTVFTKGCSLSCPWCSNPENMKMCREPYIKDGIKDTYGVYMSCGEIYNEVIKDNIFYGTWNKETSLVNELDKLPGGVTFSGGEALLWVEKLQSLWNKLKDEGVHMAIETALIVPSQSVRLAAEYIDMFYVDIKLLEPERCRDMIGGNIKTYLSNLEFLFSVSASVVFRIPVIGGYTDTEENREMVIDLIKEYRPIKAEIIKGHNLGNSKYESLGMDVPAYCEVSDDFLTGYHRMIERLGVKAEVCRI